MTLATRSPRSAFFAAAVLAILLALTVLGEVRRPLNPDVSWLLYTGDRLLRGERLYSDILEINPPLIVWLNVPIAGLAHVLHVGLPAMFRGTVVILIAASCLACVGLIGRLGLAASARGLAAIALAFVLLPMAGGMFGQREHLALALILPFAALAAVRSAGVVVSRPQALVIGLMGALGMAIKPHYGAVWLLLVAYRWWAGPEQTRRRWFPEDWVVVLLGVLYPLAVILLTPEYFAFAGGLARDYLGYGAHSLGYILLGDSPAWWFYVAAGAWLAGHGLPRRAPVAGVLMASGVGFLIAVAAQYKGWSYHYYPVNACAFLLAVCTLATAVEAKGRGILLARQVILGLFALFVIGFIVVEVREAIQRAQGTLARRELRQIAVLRAVQRQQDARSILVLSSQLRDAFPLVIDAGLRWDGGYPNVWIPLVYYRTNVGPASDTTFHAVARMAVPERAAFDRVVRDVVVGRPDLLVVESRRLNEERTGFPGGFDFLAYFGQDSAFAASLGAYRPVDEADGLRILKRGSAASAGATPRLP